MKQVERSHYEFGQYMGRPRWASVWHQLDEVLRLAPAGVLEIGPGTGVFKAAAMAFGLQVQTLDPDPELKPDFVGSALALPLPDAAVDLCCAFQVLEHLPYADSLKAFAEMVRVSRRHVVISLPDAKPLWHYRFHIPRVGPWDLCLHRPFYTPAEHRFDGEHHWEINKRGFDLARVMADLGGRARLVRHFRAPDNTYHHFFVFEVPGSGSGR